MRLKTYINLFAIIAIVLGGIFIDYLFVFIGIIIVVYFVSGIAYYYYKKNKMIEPDTMVCPRCLISVDNEERICPQCGEKL